MTALNHGVDQAQNFISGVGQFFNNFEQQEESGEVDDLYEYAHDDADPIIDEDGEEHFLDLPISCDPVHVVHMVLSTGGPATRIVVEYTPGDSDPNRITLEYSNWRIPWTTLPLTGAEQDTLDRYVETVGTGYYPE